MLKKIASNTISQIISKIATAIISIFLLSVLTKYLSIELFGVYSKVYNYLGIFAFLADLGLYTIMIREISKIESQGKEYDNIKTKGAIEKIVGNVLTLRTALGFGVIFLALAIAYFLPSYNSYYEMWAIFIVGVFTLVSLMNSTFLAYMQSQLKMEFSLLSVIVGKIVNLGMIMLIVFVFFSIEKVQLFGMEERALLYILGAGLLGIIVNTFLNYIYASKSCSLNFLYDKTYIRHILKISLPYGIALFLSVVYFKVDIILLSILEGDFSDESVALYSLPMKIVEVLMVVGGFYLNSILPKLTHLFEDTKSGEGAGHKKDLQSLLTLSFKILFSFGIMVFTFGVVFREYIIKIIASDSYLSPTNSLYNSSDAFLIVLGVLVFHFLSLLFIYIFIGAKKQGVLLKINLFITVFNIVGNILLIPYFSFVGAGIITLLSQVLLFIITFVYSRKIISFSLPKVFIGKMLLLSAVFFLVLFYVLEDFSLGLYLDVIIYGVSFSIIWTYIVYKMIQIKS